MCSVKSTIKKCCDLRRETKRLPWVVFKIRCERVLNRRALNVTTPEDRLTIGDVDLERVEVTSSRFHGST
jgi:hypothetical protein